MIKNCHLTSNLTSISTTRSSGRDKGGWCSGSLQSQSRNTRLARADEPPRVRQRSRTFDVSQDTDCRTPMFVAVAVEKRSKVADSE
jgi:hypothetical protein